MFEQPGTEEYFSSISSPARRAVQDVVEIRRCSEKEWESLDIEEREKLIDERLIDSSEGIVPKAQKYHTLDSKRRNKNRINQNCQENTVVRLSTFGVEQVFPRLKIDTGQKKVAIPADEISTNGSEDSCRGFTYRDEHSGPFSWMTRSQQELRFQAGAPDQLSEEDLQQNGLETIRTTSPKQYLIRQSRGNPSYAKPVGIPQVPKISSAPVRSPEPREPKRMSRASVSPHRINNFVCETSQNRLVFDFGDTNALKKGSNDKLNGSLEDATSGSDCSSAKSSSTSGLLAKMKEKTKTSIKRSISSVSNRARHKSGRRVKSPESGSVGSESGPIRPISPSESDVTLSSVASIQSNNTSGSGSTVQVSRPGSTMSSSLYGTIRPITKPSYAPPPPPPALAKPSGAPPPPPTNSKAATPPKNTQGLPESSNPQPEQPLTSHSETKNNDENLALEDFKVDLKINTELPKTGFDFLDDW